MFHLEIVADTAVEFADKVRDLAAQFGIATSTTAIAAATEAPAEAERTLEPVRTTRRRARPAATEEQAPEAEQTDDTPADSADAEAPAEEEAETVVPINTRRRRSAPAETAPDATVGAAVTDEAVLRNLVLRLMQAKGGPAVRAVLDGFGIARTSEVPEAQAGELAKALEEAIAA
jgi:cytoskeletal protein RodZ